MFVPQRALSSHHSYTLTPSAYDHSTTFAILRYNFNSRRLNLARTVNIEIAKRHV